MDRRTLVSEANEGHIQFLFSLFGFYSFVKGVPIWLLPI